MEAPLLKYKEEIEVRMTARSMHSVLMNAKLARLHAFIRRSKQASLIKFYTMSLLVVLL